MRRVHIPEGATPPAEWLAQAQAVTETLRAAKTEEEREALIAKHEGLWRDKTIRDWLLGHFNNKCWYTEAQDSVSAIHVDHYRPKGRVTDLERKNGWGGYWWLAFDWTNYRICGQLINVKKSDVFPISEKHRATHDDPGSLKLEAPVLIDPTTDDARLVSFEIDDDGCRAVPVVGADKAEKARVTATVHILGLNLRDQLNKKRAEVWQKCRGLIEEYRSAAQDPHALKSVRQASAVLKLKDMVRYEAELSSVAAACIFKTASEALKAKVFG